jgi:hypothetical protein
MVSGLNVVVTVVVKLDCCCAARGAKMEVGPDGVVGALKDNAMLLEGAVVATDAAILSNENSELGFPTVAGADTDGVEAVVGSEVLVDGLNWKDDAADATVSDLGVEIDDVLAASGVAGAVALKENAGADAVEAGVEVASEAFGCAVDADGKLKENAGGGVSDFVLGIDVEVAGSEAAAAGGGLKEKPEAAVTVGTDAAVSEAFGCAVDEGGNVNANGDGAVSALVEGVFVASDTRVGLNENPDAAGKAGVVVASAVFEVAADVALVEVG